MFTAARLHPFLSAISSILTSVHIDPLVYRKFANLVLNARLLDVSKVGLCRDREKQLREKTACGAGCHWGGVTRISLCLSLSLSLSLVLVCSLSLSLYLSLSPLLSHSLSFSRLLARSISLFLSFPLSFAWLLSLARLLALSLSLSLSVSLSRSLVRSLSFSPFLSRLLSFSFSRSLALSLSVSLSVSLARSLACSLSFLMYIQTKTTCLDWLRGCARIFQYKLKNTKTRCCGVASVSRIEKIRARSSEAQRAEAAVRHRGRSTFWGLFTKMNNNGGLSDFLPSAGGLSDFSPNTEVYRICLPKSGGLSVINYLW